MSVRAPAARCVDGPRRSQLLGLRWGEIGFAQRPIGFTRAFVEGDDGPVLRATKTHRSYSVAIDEGTLAVLVGHWRQALARAECVGANLTADSFVFSSDPAGARPWLPNRVTKRFIHHRRRTGLAHFRLHDLRHFMARSSTVRDVTPTSGPAGWRPADQRGVVADGSTNELRKRLGP